LGAGLDANRIALIGVLTGLLAAVIASLAVLRQPPWPRRSRAIGDADRAEDVFRGHIEGQ
jgi:hypothetical protein